VNLPRAIHVLLVSLALCAATGGCASKSPKLQREWLAALSGDAEVRPGVKLPDRQAIQNKREARDYLVSALTRIGLKAERQPYGTDSENIYAVLTCGRPSAEAVVVGAHYDTVRGAPGANDDGSGVAAVLAVAREMTRHKPRARDMIFVLFDEEERGLLGSRSFAQTLKDQNRPIHSVHTIDQVGWDSNHNRAIELEIPYEGAEALYAEAAKRLKLVIPIYVTPETGSDHVSFRRQGFKAVGITEEYRHKDTTPFIHKPGDTFQTIDFDYLTSTTRLLVEVMRTLTR